MLCDNPKLGIVNNNMYANYDPNPSIFPQDIEQKPILGINQGPLTLLKWIWDLCANNAWNTTDYKGFRQKLTKLTKRKKLKNNNLRFMCKQYANLQTLT